MKGAYSTPSPPILPQGQTKLIGGFYGGGGGSGPTGLWEGGGEGAPQAPVDGPPQVGKRRSTVHWQAAGKPRSGRPEREKHTHTPVCKVFQMH